ncbi:MAG: hypothetical protein R3B46_02270 [Phycisphaerales bacterium]
MSGTDRWHFLTPQLHQPRCGVLVVVEVVGWWAPSRENMQI